MICLELVFAPLDASVLEPDFDLGFAELEGEGQVVSVENGECNLIIVD